MKSRLMAADYPASDNHMIVGKVQKAQGIRGEIFILVFSKEAAWLKQLKSVALIKHLESSNFEKKTYQLENKRWHKDGIVVRLKGVETRNQAEELKGAMFEVPESFFATEGGESPYLTELLNLSVLDVNREILGEIIGFSSNGMQDLACVKTSSGTFDVPLVDEWIIEINNVEKTIVMDLPDGLFADEE